MVRLPSTVWVCSTRIFLAKNIPHNQFITGFSTRLGNSEKRKHHRQLVTESALAIFVQSRAFPPPELPATPPALRLYHGCKRIMTSRWVLVSCLYVGWNKYKLYLQSLNYYINSCLQSSQYQIMIIKKFILWEQRTRALTLLWWLGELLASE